MPPKRKRQFGRRTRTSENKSIRRKIIKIQKDESATHAHTPNIVSSSQKKMEKWRVNATPEKLQLLSDADKIRKFSRRLDINAADKEHILVSTRSRNIKRMKLPPGRFIGRQIDLDSLSAIAGEDAPNLSLLQLGKHYLGRLCNPHTGSFDPSVSDTCRFGCSAIYWKGEHTWNCCGKGSIKLEPLWPAKEKRLEWFEKLFKEDSIIGKLFRKHIVPLNNSLSLCSLRVKRLDPPGGGYKPSVVIQGKVAMKMGPLQSTDDPDDLPPAFVQLYVIDPQYCDKVAAIRCGNMFLPKTTSVQERENINDLMVLLQNRIRASNDFVQDFLMATEIIASDDPEPVKLIIDANKRPSGEHERRFNSDFKEISVLSSDEKYGNQDIVVRLRGRGNHAETIDDTHRAVDPLRFVLLFPTGTCGWHTGSRKVQGDETSGKCTGRMFYRYHLQVRVPFDNPDHFSALHRSGRLFQEYLCLNFAKILNQEMRFYEMNQKKVRAEKYKSAMDQYRMEDADLSKIGKMVILPPSYTGSPRYMYKKYQDAIALIRELKNPDLFMTVTANSKWPEITESLLPGQEAKDRPDLIARVFKQKLDALNKDLKESQILGKVVGQLYVVEYQKRGLPHVHCLLILDKKHSIRSPAEVDQIVWAELPPDPMIFPDGPLRNLAHILLDLVTTHMYHTCSGMCTENGKCKRFFPKPFCEETTWDESAMYPEYRRRPDREVTIKGKTYTNQYVVPYNPYLLLKYQCHINLECTISMKSIKYLYMYLYKGSDRAMVSENGNAANEIQTFQNFKSIGSSEACWRFFEFPIAYQKPPVTALRVHLEDEQTVIVEEATLKSGPPITELVAFFEYNIAHPDAEKVPYVHFPRSHCWCPGSREWKKRERNLSSIGRIQVVHPTAGDVFYLRILLHHEHSGGKTGFEDLRTIGGVTYASFKEVCGALGLLQDDGEWNSALREAANVDRSSKIRALFDVILRFCNPENPARLFDNHVSEMSDDFERTFPSANAPMLAAMVLLDLEEKLQLFGKCLEECGLPNPSKQERKAIAALKRESRLLRESVAMQEETNYDLSEAIAARNGRQSMLNAEQRSIHDEILDVVANGLQEDNILRELEKFCIFIDARGGTGKTYLLNTILVSCRTLNDEKNVAIAVASSGIAATLLTLGRTFHSRFIVPIKNYGEKVVFSLKPNSEGAKVIRAAKIIVWDEAPMLHKLIFEGLDSCLKDITGSKKPFGGKIIIIAGDFRQILPVVPHGSRASIVQSCLNRSKLFESFEIRKLSKNLRIGADPNLTKFDNFLLHLGDGTLPIAEDPDWVEAPNGTVFQLDDREVETSKETSKDRLINQLQEFVEVIFPNLKEQYRNFRTGGFQSSKISTSCSAGFWLPENSSSSSVPFCRTSSAKWVDWLASRAILAPKNSEVHFINEHIIDLFPGKSTTALSADMCIKQDDAFNYPVELLNEVNTSGVPPHDLHLKPGIILILLRNLNPRESLCNGTRLILVSATQFILCCHIASGKRAGDLVMIPRIDIIVDDTVLPLEWKRRQFPVRPAFAMTINKSQGQTLKKVGVWLRDPCFTHGQLYVASSRVGDPKNLHYAINSSDNGLMKNVVFREVLSAHSSGHRNAKRVRSVRHMKCFAETPDQLVEIPEEAVEPSFPEVMNESDDEEDQEVFLIPSVNSCKLPLDAIAAIWGIRTLALEEFMTLMHSHARPYSCSVDSVLDLLHYTFFASIKKDIAELCPSRGLVTQCTCSFCISQNEFFHDCIEYSFLRDGINDQEDIAYLNNEIWETLIERLPNHFAPKGKGTASNQEVPALFLSAEPEANKLWGIHRTSHHCSCGATTKDVLFPAELMGTEELNSFQALVEDAVKRDGQCSTCYKMVPVSQVSYTKHLIFNMDLAPDLHHSMDLLPEICEFGDSPYEFSGLVKNIGSGQDGINHFVAIVKRNGRVQVLDDLIPYPMYHDHLESALASLQSDEAILKGLTCIVYIKSD